MVVTVFPLVGCSVLSERGSSHSKSNESDNLLSIYKRQSISKNPTRKNNRGICAENCFIGHGSTMDEGKWENASPAKWQEGYYHPWAKRDRGGGGVFDTQEGLESPDRSWTHSRPVWWGGGDTGNVCCWRGRNTLAFPCLPPLYPQAPVTASQWSVYAGSQWIGSLQGPTSH